MSYLHKAVLDEIIGSNEKALTPEAIAQSVMFKVGLLDLKTDHKRTLTYGRLLGIATTMLMLRNDTDFCCQVLTADEEVFTETLH